jgi:hypothetical protein
MGGSRRLVWRARRLLWMIAEETFLLVGFLVAMVLVVSVPDGVFVAMVLVVSAPDGVLVVMVMVMAISISVMR